MEQVILVDELDREAGVAEKMAAHLQGKLHRAFSIFVFNSKGELMLQKRDSRKYHCGGLWSNTCCSHPRPGEKTEDAVHRRLKEEMGFDCELKEEFSFVYAAKLDKGITENEFDHVFVGKYDGKPTPNPEEAEDWKWVYPEQLQKDIKKNPEAYTPWFKIAIGKLLNSQKNGTSAFFDYKHREAIENELKKFLPETINAEWAEKAAGKSKWKQDTASLTAALSAPVRDFLGRGGKRWRPVLMLICSEAVGGNAEAVLPFTIIPELIHNGTLIVDDIEDNSELRRGKPVLHRIFGVDIAVNAGNTLYLLPFTAIRDSGLPEKIKVAAYGIISTQLLKCHLGQAVDIFWHSGKSDTIPTEDQYLQMCANKTGSVAAMAAKLGALLGGGTEKQIEALGSFAETAGVVFQIQDDILNLTANENIGKGFGDDVCEGKRTLLVIHALNAAAENERTRLLEILGMHTKDGSLLKEAIGIIKAHSSIEYARKLAAQMAEKAWKEAEAVLAESEAKQQLKELAQLMLDRSV